MAYRDHLLRQTRQQVLGAETAYLAFQFVLAFTRHLIQLALVPPGAVGPTPSPCPRARPRPHPSGGRNPRPMKANSRASADSSSVSSASSNPLPPYRRTPGTIS